MTKSPTSPIDLDVFTEHLSKETDRACGVLGGSVLDTSMERLLRKRLHKRQDDLLGPNGPLSSFSTRIAAAHGLQWIDDATASDLDVVRKIRNDFAHSIDHALDFASPSISSRCSNLEAANGFLEGLPLAAASNPNYSERIFEAFRTKFSAPRWRFQISVEVLYGHLDDLMSRVEVAAPRSVRVISRERAAAIRIRTQATAVVGPRPHSGE
jgi:hypothetical protein